MSVGQVIPSTTCEAEIDSYFNFKTRDKFSEGAQGDTQYANEKSTFQTNVKDSTLKCINKNYKCDYTPGRIDLAFTNLSIIKNKIEKIKKEFKNLIETKAVVDEAEIKRFEAAIRKAHILALLRCKSDIANSIHNSANNLLSGSDVLKEIGNIVAGIDKPEEIEQYYIKNELDKLLKAATNLTNEEREALTVMFFMDINKDDIASFFNINLPEDKPEKLKPEKSGKHKTKKPIKNK